MPRVFNKLLFRHSKSLKRSQDSPPDGKDAEDESLKALQ